MRVLISAEGCLEVEHLGVQEDQAQCRGAPLLRLEIVEDPVANRLDLEEKEGGGAGRTSVGIAPRRSRARTTQGRNSQPFPYPVAIEVTFSTRRRGVVLRSTLVAAATHMSALWLVNERTVAGTCALGGRVSSTLPTEFSAAVLPTECSAAACILKWTYQ